jgi:histidinol-phosphate aminotransferase
MIRPRRAVERLKKYRPPLEGRGGKLRLDFNENTVGCAPEVARALRRAINPEMLTRYPEYEEARRKLARFFGVAPQEMLLANGTDDAINLICDAFVEPGDTLVVPAPTFPVYEFFHNVAGGKAVRVRYNEDFKLPVDEVLKATSRGARWLALANPNNPTGTTVPQRDLKKLLRGAPKTLVLVDEAYYDFCGETVLPWIRKYPNLIVTRTFSKAFGLAALRMGLIFAHKETIEALHRAQNPFVVNSLALLAAGVAVRHAGHVRRYVKEVLQNRRAFCQWLERKGLAYVPSKANFVLTRVGKRAPEIARRLRAQRVLVRDWSYDPKLQGYLRFTIGSRAQTLRLMKALERLENLMQTRRGHRGTGSAVPYSTTGWFA